MRFSAVLPWLYQIPEPAGNHTKRFTDKAAFYAFRFMFCLPLRAKDRETEGTLSAPDQFDQGAFR